MIPDIQKLLPILHSRQRRSRSLLVAIDGLGGSGKSTIARALASACGDAEIIQMDDFYLPSANLDGGDITSKPIGSDFDWRRLQAQVMTPIIADRVACYQRYDWPTDSLAEWITIHPRHIVIIEGVYALRSELQGYYDLSLWVDCQRELRLARGIVRDGNAARTKWEDDWMPAEDRYVAAHNPRQHADFIIDGSNTRSIRLKLNE